MKNGKISYEALLLKLKDQELKIQEIEADLANKKNVLNQVQEHTKASSVLLYSLSIKSDKTMFYSFLSGDVEAIYGYEDQGKTNLADLVFNAIPLKDKEYIFNCILSNTASPLNPITIEYAYLHPTKGQLWHEMTASSSIDEEGTIVCKGVITDITKRILTEQKMNKAKRLCLFISRLNQIIVRVQDKEELFKEVCELAVEVGKFKMAWIGLIDTKTQKVQPISIAGDDNGYLSEIRSVNADERKKTGQGPGGKAIREGKYQICNSIEDDFIMKPWKKAALKRGFQSLIAIPIKRFDHTIGLFIIYSAEKNFFDEEEIKLLDKAATDVTFALEFYEKEKMRNTAESAVAESEKRFHTLTEISPVGIYRTDLNGATTYVNQRWTQIVGKSFKESLGNGWYFSIHPDDRVLLYKEWKKVVSQRKQSLFEFRFVKPGGRVVWVIGQATPETNRENQIIGFIGTITDITERKEAENKFIRTSKKMEAIIQAIPDMMFEIDLEGVFFNYHSSSNDLLLIPPSAFIGKNVTEVLPPEAAAVCLSGLREAHEKGFSRGKQYTLDLPFGKYWFELSLAPMKEQETKELHFIVISRDITDQKKAEEAEIKNKERYRGLLKNLEAGIVVHDDEGAIIMCNSKAAELLGHTIEELTSNKNEIKFNFINEDYSEMQTENLPISQILNSKLPIKNFPLGIKDDENDTVIWVLVSGFPMLDDEGNIQEAVISFIDVSEQRKMNYEIQKAKELAETANKSKTDFLANMSHEIRTPLNGIIGFTSLLMESNLDSNQKEYMLTINESASTLMDIVNDILDFSKIEAGKLELKIEEIDLFALINQVISLFKYQANLKQIGLELVVDASVPQFLFADHLRLKQIVINLVGNAIKFTQNGYVLLEVKAIQPFEAEYVTLIFSVKDTGIGIKEQNQTKIFHSFVQEDNSTSRQFGGTGLGLAISNQLLAMMDSKLQLESDYGKGSNFYFTIRLKKSEAKMVTEHKIVGKSIKKNILGTKKILIVEDNKINMFLAKTLISKIIPKSIIIEARDGDEAIEQYKNQQPDIILMDIQMPNKNGFEATCEIREIEQDCFTPIIALTAGIFVQEKEECLKSGMNDYVTKPINIDDLESILYKWLMD